MPRVKLFPNVLLNLVLSNMFNEHEWASYMHVEPISFMCRIVNDPCIALRVILVFIPAICFFTRDSTSQENHHTLKHQ